MSGRTCVAVLSCLLALVASTACGVAGTIDLNPGDDIQAAIDGASAGDTIQLAAGVYTPPAQISITKQITLLGAGEGATRIAGRVLVSGTAGVAISQLTIGGVAGNAITGYDGLRLQGATGCTISNVTIEYVSSSTDCSGVSIITSGNHTFTNLTVEQITGGGLALGVRVCSNVGGCQFTNTVTRFMSSGSNCASGLYLDPSTNNCTFTNNTISDLTSTGLFPAGIYVHAGNHHTFSNTTIQTLQGSSAAAGVIFSMGDHNTATNTTVSGLTATSTTGFISGLQTQGFPPNYADSHVFDGGSVSDFHAPYQVRGATINSGSENCAIRNVTVDLGGVVGTLGAFGLRILGGAANVVENCSVDNAAIGLQLTSLTNPLLDIGSTSFGSGCTEFIRLTTTATDVDATSCSFSGAPTDADKEARVYHYVDDFTLGFVDWGQGTPGASTLSVQSASGATGATVQLAARLTSGGSPLVGETVDFTVAAAGAGSAATDSNGWARVNYAITQTAGTYTIGAAFAGTATTYPAAGTGTLTVTTPAPTSITLTMAPNPVDAGATSTATVMGDNGVDYSAVATCYIQYGAGGSWAGNVYTSAKAGTWTVTAVYGSLAATDTLTVNHGAVATVTLSPANASITTDQTQTYTAQATDAQGNSWTPKLSTVKHDGFGSLSFPSLDRVVYHPAAADGGTTVQIDVQVDNAPIWSNRAYLDVTSSGSGGTPLILAWDKDTATFYLCTDAANPQTGTPLVMGTNTVGGITVTVAKTGSSSTDLVATVTNGGAPGNSLRVRWYLRSGAVDKCYSYSTISGVTHTAVYSLGRTSVDGGRSQVGFFGLAHNLNADPPTAITYSVVQQ